MKASVISREVLPFYLALLALGAAALLLDTLLHLFDIGLRTSKGAALPKPAVKASFHQDLIEQDCMACHSDHTGPKLTQHSRKPFSHALLRPATRER